MREENNHYRFQVERGRAGRIDTFLKEEGFSSRLISSIKRAGLLTLNDRPARFVDDAKEGDTIDVYLPKEKIDCTPSDGYELDILYEDDEILVVNKPAFVVTHPTTEYREHTLGNYIAHYFEKTGQDVKIRFVNRLDRDTTGIIIIAKNKFVHHYIQSRMSGDEVEKTYLALTEGELNPECGKIDLPIYRPDSESIERVVDSRGQPSVTDYKLLEKLSKANLVECRLETGRTHQIRVHFKAIGSPLVGDPLYNAEAKERFGFNRQALHAWKMKLKTPKRGELSFEAPIPEDMMDFCSRYRRET